jgi:hypothetical protein
MKKIIFLIIITSISLTSCIEIVEEMWINEDKSGKLELRIDAGSLGVFFNSIGQYIGEDLSKKIINAPNKMASSLNKIKGISNVKPITNPKSGKLGLSFNFENQHSLNNALYSIFGLNKKFFYPNAYKIKNHKIKKKDFTNYLTRYFEENKSKIKSDEIIKMINYITIYHLPKDVKKIKNEIGTKLSDKITVIQSNSLENILKEQIDLGQVISF